MEEREESGSRARSRDIQRVCEMRRRNQTGTMTEATRVLVAAVLIAGCSAHYPDYDITSFPELKQVRLGRLVGARRVRVKRRFSPAGRRQKPGHVRSRAPRALCKRRNNQVNQFFAVAATRKKGDELVGVGFAGPVQRAQQGAPPDFDYHKRTPVACDQANNTTPESTNQKKACAGSKSAGNCTPANSVANKRNKLKASKSGE